MKNKVARIRKKNQLSKKIAERYKALSYRLIGRYLINTEKTGSLQEKLKMANMKFTPSMFYATIIMTGILTIVLSIIIYSLFFQFLLNQDLWLLDALILTGITTTVIISMFFFVINSRISSRRSQIDHEIPFVLSELSILASTGLTPIKIMRHMAQRKGEPAMTSEFRKIISKIDVEGKDIITAISEAAKETPSPLFRETLWDLCNMMHQGGDLDAYLRSKADITLQLKRDIQKEFIDKLATYSELYTSLVLVGVLFVGIAAFLLDAMGSTISGMTADSLLQILSYGIIPIAIITMNILVSLSYAKSG